MKTLSLACAVALGLSTLSVIPAVNAEVLVEGGVPILERVIGRQAGGFAHNKAQAENTAEFNRLASEAMIIQQQANIASLAKMGQAYNACNQFGGCSDENQVDLSSYMFL